MNHDPQSAPSGHNEPAERIHRLIGGLTRLPSAPASASRILTAATREVPDLNELVEHIEDDPAVSLQLLRVANAAGSGLGTRIESVRQAAMLLGVETVCTVALCVSVREGLFKTFDSGDPPVLHYWRHSLACACAAGLLAAKARPGIAGAAFAAGLIHDCGKLALMTAAPEEYAKIMADEFLAGTALVEAEQAALGADHCLAGKWLLERWGLPEFLAEVAWTHHQPSSALLAGAGTSDLCLVVSLADRLTHEAMGALPMPSGEAECLGLAQALGLTDQKVLASVKAGIGAEFARRAGLFEFKEDAAGFYFNALERANRRLGGTALGLTSKSASLERDARALRAVALAGVEIARADSPQGVLLAVAGAMSERFASPGGAAILLGTEAGAAQGHLWGFGGPMRPVAFALLDGCAPAPDPPLPPEIAGLIPGCPTRASALAGPEGPPVHYQDGMAMAGLTEGGPAFGELFFRPAAGRVTPEERTAVSLLAQLAASAMKRLELMRRCEARSERLAQVMRSMQEMNGKLAKTQRLAAVGQLAAGAAHEINNPLAIISARAQLLQMRESDPDKKKGLGQMVEQIERISSILASLMDFARPAPPAMAPVNPREVMDKVLDLMEGTLGAQNIVVKRDYRTGTPDLMADSRQLEQVFLNLVLNAQHAMEQGGGNLTVSIGYDKTADSVWFRVDDTGTGIVPENLEKVFDPFYTTKPEGKGTGLGLSTAHGIVAAHGGSITARSEPGRGSAFTVTLPRGLPGRRAGAVPAAARAKRPAVLVVDDEGHIRDILKEAFESRGQPVECAEDVASALSLLRANRYRLAILDIRMPGPSGLALLDEASSFAGPDTPVIVLTGMASDAELAEAKRLGAAACMRKPFKMEELLVLSAGLMKPVDAA